MTGHEILSDSTTVKMTVRQLIAIIVAVVVTPVAGTWWLATHMATKEELRPITTDVAALKSDISLVRVDVAVLKDRTERKAPAP